ncbi:helix-turn-helix domain-containing protein [Microbispora rosea]|uniref:helix-turn-helix domain-containing protein n=1 Tax=Microbispora rosea TaxID=58117 RepID=UPI00135632A8|nr:AraC family transcriptional regulator [Microbispora rosea]
MGVPGIVPGPGPAEYEVIRAKGVATVGGYTGYRERLTTTLWRRELPSSDVVMLITFGNPIQLPRPPRGGEGGSSACLVAALHDRVAVTGHSGLQYGVEVRLSPLRAYSLLGLPMNAISNELVDMAALLGTNAAHLTERLAAAPDWRRRFDILNAALTARVAAGPAPDPAVRWAWQRLKSGAGATPIAVLAEQIGWSRRHLERRFGQQVGLPPKTVARIFRFERALGLLADRSRGLAEIAVRAGYSDQAHFSRELRALTQRTPRELTASLRSARV